jgi:cobaltochelatase CobN
MLETARKGMWKAGNAQLSRLTDLHTALVKEYGSAGAGFAGGNAKLHDFIAAHVNPQTAQTYRARLEQMQTANAVDAPSQQGMVLHKQEVTNDQPTETNQLNGLLITAVVLVAFVALLVVLRRKRRR